MKPRECQVRVIYANTDAMGIVYNGTYISWLEKGRGEWLRDAGYPGLMASFNRAVMEPAAPMSPAVTGLLS